MGLKAYIATRQPAAGRHDRPGARRRQCDLPRPTWPRLASAAGTSRRDRGAQKRLGGAEDHAVGRSGADHLTNDHHMNLPSEREHEQPSTAARDTRCRMALEDDNKQPLLLGAVVPRRKANVKICRAPWWSFGRACRRLRKGPAVTGTGLIACRASPDPDPLLRRRNLGLDGPQQTAISSCASSRASFAPSQQQHERGPHRAGRQRRQRKDWSSSSSDQTRSAPTSGARHPQTSSGVIVGISSIDGAPRGGGPDHRWTGRGRHRHRHHHLGRAAAADTPALIL